MSTNISGSPRTGPCVGRQGYPLKYQGKQHRSDDSGKRHGCTFLRDRRDSEQPGDDHGVSKIKRQRKTGHSVSGGVIRKG